MRKNSEIIGSVLLYPKGTVIAIPGSAQITLSSPEVRLLGRVTAEGTIKAIVRDLELQRRDWALAGYFLPSSGSLGAVTGLFGRAAEDSLHEVQPGGGAKQQTSR